MERYRAYQREYQRKYRETHREARRAYYEKHKEKLRARARERYVSPPARLILPKRSEFEQYLYDREQQASYRAANRERQAGRNAQLRCTEPRTVGYSLYGGRGIEWRFESLDAFVEHIGPKPSPAYSLDRVCVNWHYEPGNVRWATRKEQTANKRNTDGTCKCHGKTLVELSE